jgi:hypothetical protein
MKKNWIFITMALALAGCLKTHDVPSLDEQIQRKWRVASYWTDEYAPTGNSVTRYHYQSTGRPADYMTFSSFDRLLVNFDSVPPAVWNYRTIDFSTIVIEGKKWGILKLNEDEFHLSLTERDSSMEQKQVVEYELIKP